MKTSSIPKIPAKISQFIEINSILSLATVINNKPYCSNCFYYFWKKEYTLIIKSFIETRHIREALVNPYVAGTIYYDSSKMDLVRGIQFTGLLYHIAGEQTKIVEDLYYKKFPLAQEITSEIFGIKLNFIQWTDKGLGVGKKIVWSAESDE